MKQKIQCFILILLSVGMTNLVTAFERDSNSEELILTTEISEEQNQIPDSFYQQSQTLPKNIVIDEDAIIEKPGTEITQQTDETDPIKNTISTGVKEKGFSIHGLPPVYSGVILDIRKFNTFYRSVFPKIISKITKAVVYDASYYDSQTIPNGIVYIRKPQHVNIMLGNEFNPLVIKPLEITQTGNFIISESDAIKMIGLASKTRILEMAKVAALY